MDPIVFYDNFLYGSEKQGDILQLRFFISQEGQLDRVYLLERCGRKMVWLVDEEHEFSCVTEDRLEEAFRRLALGNPKDFYGLYQILKRSKQEKAFACIQKIKEEIQQLFNFS